MKLTKNSLFKDFADFWLENYMLGFVKDNTYMGTYYHQTYYNLIPYFGKFKISDIKPSMIQKFFNLQGQKYALETLKKLKFCLSNILAVAVDERIISSNPVNKRIRINSTIPPTEKRVWCKEHFDCAYQFALTHPHGLSPLLLMDTAISRSELLGIRWKNIIWDDSCVKIRDGTVIVQDPISKKYHLHTEGLKNKYRERDIPFSKEVCNHLKLQYQSVVFFGKSQGLNTRQINDRFVISTQKGTAMDPNNWTKRYFKTFMNDLIIKYPDMPALTPHELRHTRATLWWQEGVDLLSLGMAGGWGNLRMLRERYAHSNVDHLKKVLNR